VLYNGQHEVAWYTGLLHLVQHAVVVVQCTVCKCRHAGRDDHRRLLYDLWRRARQIPETARLLCTRGYTIHLARILTDVVNFVLFMSNSCFFKRFPDFPNVFLKKVVNVACGHDRIHPTLGQPFHIVIPSIAYNWSGGVLPAFYVWGYRFCWMFEMYTLVICTYQYMHLSYFYVLYDFVCLCGE